MLGGYYVFMMTGWKREYVVRQRIEAVMFHAALHHPQSLNKVSG
jgi:hypothetical protein